MKLYRIILGLAILLCGVSCRELPLNIGGDKIVASVDNKTLRVSELSKMIPAGLSREDSLSFVTRYTEKWILNRVKLLEAERLFESSASDIDDMVEEYRNSLMVRRLDKYYVDENFKEMVSDQQIEDYYAEHGDNFKLTTHLVKGRILTFPKSYKNHEELLKQMSTLADKRGGDFKSICEKRGLELEEFTEWIDYSDLLNRLPVVRSGDLVDYLLRSMGDVRQLEDRHSRYYFQITEAMGVGDREPIERVKDKIIYILNSKNQAELLGEYEIKLLEEANAQEIIRNYTNEK